MELALMTPSYSMEIIRNIYSLPYGIVDNSNLEGCLKLDIRRNSNFQILGFQIANFYEEHLTNIFSERVISNLILDISRWFSTLCGT